MITARASDLEPGDRIYVRGHDLPVRVTAVDRSRAVWVSTTCACCCRGARRLTYRFTPWVNVKLAAS